MMRSVEETILSYPGVGGSEEYIHTVLTNRSLQGAVSYSSEMKRDVELAVADIYAMLGGLPDFRENKLSITYPRAWYRRKAIELYLANGEEDKALELSRSNVIVPRGKSTGRW